jgi:hypothetical protein
MDIQNSSTVNTEAFVDDGNLPTERDLLTFVSKSYLEGAAEIITEYINDHPGCTQKEVIAITDIKQIPAAGLKKGFQKMLREKSIYRGKALNGGPMGYYLTGYVPKPTCDTSECIKW